MHDRGTSQSDAHLSLDNEHCDRPGNGLDMHGEMEIIQDEDNGPACLDRAEDSVVACFSYAHRKLATYLGTRDHGIIEEVLATA